MPPGDSDYSPAASAYRHHRRADPRIAGQIDAALGEATTLLNVGAGGGSYEPFDRYVVAVEPSAAMRAQRPRGAVPAVDAIAEQLPFDDQSFDAVMAILTVHQWRDWERGMQEMRRVSRGTVVIMTVDPQALTRLWLIEYFPEVIATAQRRLPVMTSFTRALGVATEVRPVAIPHDCSDGFPDAYYARPEALLDPDARAAQSDWALTDTDAVNRGVQRLADDLRSGAWDRRHGHLRKTREQIGAVRLIVATW